MLRGHAIARGIARRLVLAAAITVSLAILPHAGFAQVQSKPATQPALADGPYLFHEKDGSVTAKWVAGGEVKHEHFAAGKPIELARFAPLVGESLKLPKMHQPDKAIWPAPEKLLAISDVEGEYTHMLRFLRTNGVVDEKGKWSFGKGHLVCVGDMVDRGTQVTETLWLLYRLTGEAKAAGGRVHYVLGNHEAMMMGGDVRYTAPKYKAVAKLFGIPCEGLVGADTEIGRFLRSRNAVVRVGKLLFVHGGISAPVAAARKVDIERLNELMRSVLGVPPTKIDNQMLLSLVWGRAGPFWYRGYFREFTLDFGPPPSVSTLDEILANLGAKTIVIGHTKVKKVTPMFGKRRVLPIDIPWTNVDKVRGILVRGERIDVVDVRGKRTELK